MSHCKDCKFFDHPNPERYLFGDCRRQDVPGALFSVYDDMGDRQALPVDPEFGCVHFEAKP